MKIQFNISNISDIEIDDIKLFFLMEINVAFEKSSLLREVLEPFGKMEWTHFYNRYFDNRYGYV